jgi:hypothetical protein
MTEVSTEYENWNGKLRFYLSSGEEVSVNGVPGQVMQLWEIFDYLSKMEISGWVQMDFGDAKAPVEETIQ